MLTTCQHSDMSTEGLGRVLSSKSRRGQQLPPINAVSPQLVLSIDEEVKRESAEARSGDSRGTFQPEDYIYQRRAEVGRSKKGTAGIAGSDRGSNQSRQTVGGLRSSPSVCAIASASLSPLPSAETRKGTALADSVLEEKESSKLEDSSTEEAKKYIGLSMGHTEFVAILNSILEPVKKLMQIQVF